MRVENFLKDKGMIGDLSKKFVINGDFGVVLLNDLLEEYAKIKVNEETESIKQWLSDMDYEGLAESL